MRRAQSAIEYLITYGWAILIITIVLVAFYAFGLLQPFQITARASQGSCVVIRPPVSTTTPPSLQGTCNGELPQYVAILSGNTTSSLVQANVPSPGTLTVSAWFEPRGFNNFQSTGQDTLFAVGNPANYFEVYADSSGYLHAYDAFGPTICSSTSLVPVSQNQWYSVIAVSNSSGTYIYLNGVLSNFNGKGCTGRPVPSSTYHVLDIGTFTDNYTNPFFGTISNVQYYNASFTAGDAQALYSEGIGGAPIDLNDLVGWWPLNGGAEDYGGHGYEGIASNITYTGTWTSGYTAP